MKTILSNLTLMLGAAAHFILSGAALFGDIVIAPVVLSEPPASLEMFQAPYAYDSSPFWQPANMVALGIIVIAVIFNWKKPRKKLVIAWLAGFIIITVLSIGFVFPEYMEITATPFTNNIDPELVERGANWKVLSWIRGIIFFAIGFLALIALSRPLQGSDEG